MPARAWTCPSCKRSFGRRNQSHGCRPSSTVDAYFSGRPPAFRAVYESIARFVLTLGPVVIDPVSVGVMFKRTRTFAELRAKKDRVVLGLLLSREVSDPLVVKSLRLSARRTAIFVDLARPADFSAPVRAWLRESYLDSPP